MDAFEEYKKLLKLIYEKVMGRKLVSKVSNKMCDDFTKKVLCHDFTNVLNFNEKGYEVSLDDTSVLRITKGTFETGFSLDMLPYIIRNTYKKVL